MTNPSIAKFFGMITETQTVGVLRHLPFFFTWAFGHLGSTLPEPFFTWAFAFGHTT